MKKILILMALTVLGLTSCGKSSTSSDTEDECTVRPDQCEEKQPEKPAEQEEPKKEEVPVPEEPDLES